MPSLQDLLTSLLLSSNSDAAIRGRWRGLDRSDLPDHYRQRLRRDSSRQHDSAVEYSGDQESSPVSSTAATVEQSAASARTRRRRLRRSAASYVTSHRSKKAARDGALWCGRWGCSPSGAARRSQPEQSARRADRAEKRQNFGCDALMQQGAPIQLDRLKDILELPLHHRI